VIVVNNIRQASEPNPLFVQMRPTSRRLTEFPWPALSPIGDRPRWQGEYFLVGQERNQVLCYEAADSNWRPELTALHEVEAGSNHPIDQASRTLAVRSLRRFTPQQDIIVLDVGCSSGFLLEELRQAEPKMALIGADFIRQPLSVLACRLPGVPLLQFDLRKCPLPDQCVDAVTALNVLEHIDRDAVALRQIWRILKPGGLAHIEVPAGPHLYDIYDEHLMHHRRYELQHLVGTAREAEFEVLKATHLGVLMYPVFAWVKRKNRRFLHRPTEEKQQIVSRQIRTTSHSHLLRVLLRLETAIGDTIDYPFGIRCVLILRKRDPSDPPQAQLVTGGHRGRD
jgi:SAM-dependent methyltransferase